MESYGYSINTEFDAVADLLTKFHFTHKPKSFKMARFN